MKKPPLAVLIISTGMTLCSLAGGQTPDGPVFNITVEQNGSSDGEKMVKNVKAGYWPCAIWNSGYFGGESFSDQSVMGAQTTATPEGLLARRGSIAGMKPGEVLLFYVREKSGTGNEGHCFATLSTIGDGVFSCTVVSGDDKGTYTAGGPVTEPGRRAFGPAGTANAIIKRTAEGAILTFSEPNLEAEGYCDFFGLFDGENTPEALPEVFTFKLTNDELKNWSTLQKVNDRTLPGPLGGSLHIRAVLTSGVFDEKKADVTLGGCSELSTGEEGQVNATGKPEGGSYRFWSEPPGMLMIESEGPSATLTGSRPGRGTLYVEYTTPDGARTEASKPASVVGILSYNGGDTIPPIPLYDVDGKKLPGKLTVPYSSEPEEAQELVDFVSGNSSVFTVVASAENLDIEASKTGKATLEARDNCGNTAGPTVEVEVVNCTDETKARLAEEARIATEIIKEQLKLLEKIINSEEYLKASGRFLESSANLTLKTSGLIFGMAAGAPGADQVVQSAGKVFGSGSALLDLSRSGNLSEAGMNTVKLGIELVDATILGVISGAQETYQAATEFGEDLGGIQGATLRLSNAQMWIEHWSRYIDDLIRRQKLCESGAGQDGGQGEPVPEPVQKPAEPGSEAANQPAGSAIAAEPGGGQPSDEKPAPNEAAGEKSPDEGEPGGEEVPGEGGEISPPKPPSEARHEGLPYAPGECGCNSTKTMKAGPEIFAKLQADMQNLNNCVGDFQNGPLTSYVKTIEEWKTLTGELTSALGKDQKSIETVLHDVIPRMEALLQQTQSFDIAGKEFIKDFEKCPALSSSWMDLLKSAVTVTVDSIKTKY